MARLTVRWSKHIDDKLDKVLSRLGITKDLLTDIVSKPDEVLFDSENGRNIAVRLKRNLAVIYEPRVKDMFIITAIHSRILSVSF